MSSAKKTYRIAVIPGDGIGKEVMPEGLRVIEAAAALLPIAAIFQIFDGTQAVGCGVLRGVAATRAAAVINFVGYWILGLPIGLLLAFQGRLGPRGLWWGLTAGLMVVAVLLCARIFRRFTDGTVVAR